MSSLEAMAAVLGCGKIFDPTGNVFPLVTQHLTFNSLIYLQLNTYTHEYHLCEQCCVPVDSLSNRV